MTTDDSYDQNILNLFAMRFHRVTLDDIKTFGYIAQNEGITREKLAVLLPYNEKKLQGVLAKLIGSKSLSNVYRYLLVKEAPAGNERGLFLTSLGREYVKLLDESSVQPEPGLQTAAG